MSSETRLEFDDLLAKCIESAEAGTLNIERVLVENPDHAEELRRFFANQSWLVHEEQPVSDLTGRRLGDFEILDPIGRGGMGVVYRARQISLGRDVAVKVIHAGSLAGEELRSRFRLEAAAAARLEHPGIVPILDFGCDDGLDWLAMRLIDGPTLSEVIERGPVGAEQAAGWMASIGRAVQAAHQSGVVHRDLKPENIILDSTTSADQPCPVVMDFGLALTAEDASVTRSGQIVGTPLYMSPQQASGVVAVDHRADLYSLGAVLYAAVAGRAPHGTPVDGQPPGLAEALRRVLQDDPPPVQTVARDVPSPLARIIDTALQYDPAARYDSAAAMADDLDRFLVGEPVVASEVGVVRRMIEEMDRDTHGGHFRSWARTLSDLAWIILAAHVAIDLLVRAGVPAGAAYWGPRVTMLAAIAGRVWVAREGALWPRGAAERPVFSIWIAYLTCLGCINAFVLAGAIDTRLLLPIASVLSAFGFIAMAGHVWGAIGLMGPVFLVVAAVCLAMPSWSALVFGIAWWVGLTGLSWHYRETGSGRGSRWFGRLRRWSNTLF